MSRRLRSALEAIWYAEGSAQFLIYGVWVIVLSGLYSLTGAWELLAAIWKLEGLALLVATVWGSLRTKQALILLTVMTAIGVGAVFTTKAAMLTDGNILRGATQSHYMTIAVLVAWGFYLANLCSRQRLELSKMGVSDE